MTEPSQYFKGRTVQEQMDEVIGYVDVRAEEVAAVKANDVLEPAEQAKDDAIAAKEAAEDARDTTLAALPAVNERIDDVESDLNAVTLRVTTAEGQIVTIQGRVTALETADGRNVKLTGEHAIGNYAVLLTGNQPNIVGDKGFSGIITNKRDYPRYVMKVTNVDITNITAEQIDRGNIRWLDMNEVEMGALRFNILSNGATMIQAKVRNSDGTSKYVIIAVGDSA